MFVVSVLCDVVVWLFYCFFSSRRRHTRCALVTGVQTCALPISAELADADSDNYLTAIARFQNQDVEIIDVEKVLAEILGGPAGLSTALGETMQDRKSVV